MIRFNSAPQVKNFKAFAWAFLILFFFTQNLRPQIFSRVEVIIKTDADVEKVGTEWLIAQSRELKNAGVPVLHYYTLGKPKVIYNAVKEIR